MAATYTLIASNVLGSSAASVTFSSIPQTYTDLVLKTNMRNDDAGAVNDPVTVVGGSSTSLRETNSSTLSSASTSGNIFYTNGPSSTASTFSNSEVYIPNYTSSTKKPCSAITMAENNGTTNAISASSLLTTSTAAITSLTVSNVYGNFVAGSSFYLYGIKNA